MEQIRLIDAEKLKDAECDGCMYKDCERDECRKDCTVMARIDKMPTVELLHPVAGTLIPDEGLGIYGIKGKFVKVEE